MLKALDAEINQREPVEYFDEVLLNFPSLHFDLEAISKWLIAKWFESRFVDAGGLGVILHHLTDPLELLSQIADEQLFADLPNGAHEKHDLVH